VARDRYRVYEADHPCLLTWTLVGWVPAFTRRETFQIVYDAWSWLCWR